MKSAALLLAVKKLKDEIIRRKTGELALMENKEHYRVLFEESVRTNEHLKNLSRQILFAQEEERRKISRELHDEIVQTLNGISVHLAVLKKEAAINRKGINAHINRTQKLVEKSVNIVHRYARNLRPMILDDLGLIPALHSYMKEFTKRNHIPITFKATAGVEKLNSTKRMVFYRVVQGALTNVARHARASRIKVTIQKEGGNISVEINDNGKAFNIAKVLFAKKNIRLGLLGMRERVEMIGGNLIIQSSPGKGTTIRAEIPS